MCVFAWNCTHTPLRGVRSPVHMRHTPPRRVLPRLRQRVCVSLKVFPVFIAAGPEAARIPGSSHLSCYFTDQQHVAVPWPLAAAVRNDASLRARVSNTTFIVSLGACLHVKRHHLRVCLSRGSWKDGSRVNSKDLKGFVTQFLFYTHNVRILSDRFPNF